MSDLAIEFRVKNGRLKRAILKDWPSYAEFARANGISYGKLNDLLGMRQKAFGVDDWRPAAVDIATALRVEPEELWPGEMRAAELRRNNGEFAMSLDEAAQIVNTRQIERRALAALARNLTKRELSMVMSIARDETLEEAGVKAGIHGEDISPERVRQMRIKAINKMRRVAAIEGIAFNDIMVNA